GAGPPDYTNPTVNTFPTGTFTVQAIDSITLCPSDPATITINDVTVIPDLLVSVDSEQISCDTLAPTGQLSGAVNVSGTPTTTGYTFNWYKGPNDIIPARPGYTGGPTADSLEAGGYRLVVIEDVTNCTSFTDTLVQDMTVTPPDITLVTTDVTMCASPNGSITVTVVGNPADYTYEVYKGFGVIADSLISNSNNTVITDLPIGNYTVIAKDLITKCETNPVTATINDTTVPPDATFISQDQISCDPINLTGQLTAAVGAGVATDYTFEWFENDLSGAPIAPSSIDGEIISGLDSGNYVLRITNKTTQCTNVYYPSVNIGIVLPVESVSAVPSTFCGTAANGQLIATVDGGLTEVDGYTFIWESVDNGDTLVATTATLTFVEPGDYFLTVINNATACASNPAPVTVDDNTVIPDPTLTVVDNSSCDVNNPNGEVQVIGINNEPNPFSDYNYTWYDGNSSGSQLVAPNVSFPMDPDSSQISSLTVGTVALVITNKITTCSNEVLSVINKIDVKPIIDQINVTDATRCTEPYMSGALIPSIDGIPVSSGYTFEWTYLDGAAILPIANDTILDDAIDAYALPPGNYQAIAYDEYNCPSDPVAFEIKGNSVPPAFNLVGYNNISCDPFNPVGSLIASRLNNSYNIATYEWFENNTGGTLLSATSPNDSILYNLDDGTYAVRITDAATECISVEYANLIDLPANNPLIDTSYINGLTSCIVPNGEFGLEVNPLEQIPPLYSQNRSYTFYTENNLTLADTTAPGVQRLTTIPAGPSPNEVTFIDVNSGDWTSLVVDNYTHCVSTPLTINISEVPGVIIQVLDSILPADCDPLSTGSFQLESSSGVNSSPGGAGFIYSWEYWGKQFTGPAVPNPGIIDGAGSDSFIQKRDSLISGYYVVSVVDNFTSCTS
ncbi:MAG: hypothetical protein KAI99_21465, partial [Cyclobacteriaceae bacterium]|nr:hypothetical protein [Cyclobacteriaceae bacterium]